MINFLKFHDLKLKNSKKDFFKTEFLKKGDRLDLQKILLRGSNYSLFF